MGWNDRNLGPMTSHLVARPCLLKGRGSAGQRERSGPGTRTQAMHKVSPESRLKRGTLSLDVKRAKSHRRETRAPGEKGFMAISAMQGLEFHPMHLSEDVT